MAKHDITSRDSPVVVYVSENEVYIHPCSSSDHIYAFDQGASGFARCVYCGKSYVAEREKIPHKDQA